MSIITGRYVKNHYPAFRRNMTKITLCYNCNHSGILVVGTSLLNKKTIRYDYKTYYTASR